MRRQPRQSLALLTRLSAADAQFLRVLRAGSAGMTDLRQGKRKDAAEGRRGRVLSLSIASLLKAFLGCHKTPEPRKSSLTSSYKVKEQVSSLADESPQSLVRNPNQRSLSHIDGGEDESGENEDLDECVCAL